MRAGFNRRSADKDFSPQPGSCLISGGVVNGPPVAVRLDHRTWAALEEAAWLDRTRKTVLVEELVVAYLRDRFPDRRIPLRDEVKYGEVPMEDDEDEDETPDVELSEGVRHYEHNELHWRSNGHRGRPVRS